jgi:hypothetical protein
MKILQEPVKMKVKNKGNLFCKVENNPYICIPFWA